MIRITELPSGLAMTFRALRKTRRFPSPKPEVLRIFEEGARALRNHDTDGAGKAIARLFVLRVLHNDIQAGRLHDLLMLATLATEVNRARTTRRHNTRRAAV
ncbi:hypothetical protein LG325_03280 [Marinobacter nauticus]